MGGAREGALSSLILKVMVDPVVVSWEMVTPVLVPIPVLLVFDGRSMLICQGAGVVVRS